MIVHLKNRIVFRLFSDHHKGRKLGLHGKNKFVSQRITHKFVNVLVLFKLIDQACSFGKYFLNSKMTTLRLAVSELFRSNIFYAEEIILKCIKYRK